MSDQTFNPLTAREALLAIQCARAEIHADSDPFEIANQIRLLVDAGLGQMGPINFELSDQLADRLAEAHRALKIALEHLYGKLPDGDNEIEGIINEALALPPDLETMVERRMKP